MLWSLLVAFAVHAGAVEETPLAVTADCEQNPTSALTAALKEVSFAVNILCFLPPTPAPLTIDDDDGGVFVGTGSACR